MRITVLGTGTAAPQPERACAGIHVTGDDATVLLDCGPGTVERLARFTSWPVLTHVVVTHFHNDHIGDVPFLLFALKHGLPEPRTEPLVLAGPVGLRERLDAMAAAFGSHVTEPGFPVFVREMEPGEALDAGGLRVSCTPARHTPEAVCLRVESDAGRLGYTGDTGPDERVAAFLTGVDVLIAECSLPDPQAIDSHLSPTSVAALARAARPGELILTHLYPQVDRSVVLDQVRAAGWTGAARVAADGLRVAIPRGREGSTS